MKRKTSSPRQIAEKIAHTLRQQGFQALFAGGCVRDLLLKLTPKDYDIVTDARPEHVTALFPRSQLVGAQFGVVVVRLGGLQTEVATFRQDGRYVDGRHPEEVIYGSPESDARRRDFTINGMFMDPESGEIIDFVGGRADVEARLIRAIGEPNHRFEEDHLRLLRAVRFAARLDYEIEPATFDALRCHADQLPRISTERIRIELEQILAHPSRARGWRLLHESGLTKYLVPRLIWSSEEIHGVYARLTALPSECAWPVPMATLFFSRSPRAAAESCRRLTCSSDVAKSVQWLWARARFFLDTTPWELADLKMLKADPRHGALLTLLSAELTGRGLSQRHFDELVLALEGIDPRAAAPPPLLTGDDLLALNVPQGPIYSVILDRVYRDQLNEHIHSKEEALRLAHDMAGQENPN